MAQAQIKAGLFTAAHASLETIWFESPRSPWAREARTQLRELESRNELRPRRLTDKAHYEFIKALRAAGLHAEALEEIAAFRQRYPGYPKTDGALFLKAMSHYWERENEACVETVENLWRDHPSSRWLQAAGIYAIKAYRRSDSTLEIRLWTHRILGHDPNGDKAFAALYELGGHLGNVVDKEQGIRVLTTLVNKGGRHRNVTDALWKIVWFERNLGRTERAGAALERLLKEHPQSGYRNAVLYWLARWLTETDSKRAVGLYQTCIEEFPNDYYGHLARARLRGLGVAPRPIKDLGPFPKVDRLDDPAARPESAYRRAVELKSLGIYEFAAAELESLAGRSRDLGLKLALAELYSRSGRIREAEAILNRHFKAFIDSGSRDPSQIPREFWRVLYPFSYQSEIEEALAELQDPKLRVDPYLIAAVIRRESRFQPTVVSRTGAIGLMQLMPETAESVAQQLGLETPSPSELYDPKLNVRLGTFHLAQRIAEFDGRWVPAVCAYNADVEDVRKWWSQRPPDQPLDVFIENIPFGETRLFIKKIIAAYEVYRWIYAAQSGQGAGKGGASAERKSNILPPDPGGEGRS
ncbi:MAG: transglycosylase SLT domain-containing protein [bacterium]|nr:transglycosylase SLT domain-containing protein [bacterium]